VRLPLLVLPLLMSRSPLSLSLLLVLVLLPLPLLLVPLLLLLLLLSLLLLLPLSLLLLLLPLSLLLVLVLLPLLLLSLRLLLLLLLPLLLLLRLLLLLLPLPPLLWPLPPLLPLPLLLSQSPLSLALSPHRSMGRRVPWIGGAASSGSLADPVIEVLRRPMGSGATDVPVPGTELPGMKISSLSGLLVLLVLVRRECRKKDVSRMKPGPAQNRIDARPAVRMRRPTEERRLQTDPFQYIALFVSPLLLL
jgi:hypothetical protein